jgi:hypothetical protein
MNVGHEKVKLVSSVFFFFITAGSAEASGAFSGFFGAESAKIRSNQINFEISKLSYLLGLLLKLHICANSSRFPKSQIAAAMSFLTVLLSLVAVRESTKTKSLEIAKRLIVSMFVFSLNFYLF